MWNKRRVKTRHQANNESVPNNSLTSIAVANALSLQPYQSTVLPPTPDDPIYLAYLNMMSSNIQCTTGYKLLTFLKNDVRTSWAADLIEIKARQ